MLKPLDLSAGRSSEVTLRVHASLFHITRPWFYILKIRDIAGQIFLLCSTSGRLPTYWSQLNTQIFSIG